MTAISSELPLILFTTLASVGSGAFIALAAAFSVTGFTDEQLKRIDRMTILPLLVTVAGFVCAFFHLAGPVNAVHVFEGIGSSPLSNEILAGSVFLVLAFVYWVLALAGKLSRGARIASSLVIAALALVFSAFMGAAYMMDTIPSWDSVMTPLQMLGLSLAGGISLGVLTLSLAGGLDKAGEGGLKKSGTWISLFGLVLSIVGLAGQLVSVNGLYNALVSGSSLVSEALPFAVAGLIVLALGTLLCSYALRGRSKPAPVALSALLAVAGVFLCRVCFYALEISAGLSM